jgi:hypothetical protein
MQRTSRTAATTTAIPPTTEIAATTPTAIPSLFESSCVNRYVCDTGLETTPSASTAKNESL